MDRRNSTMLLTIGYKRFSRRFFSLSLAGLLGLVAHPALAANLPIQDPDNVLTSAELQILQNDLAQIPSYRLQEVQSVLIQTSGGGNLFDTGVITGNQLIIYLPIPTQQLSP